MRRSGALQVMALIAAAVVLAKLLPATPRRSFPPAPNGPRIPSRDGRFRLRVDAVHRTVDPKERRW